MKRRFEQFCVASGLSEDSEGKQVSTLLYCLGEQAEAVLISTNATAEDRATYSSTITKFDGFFKIRKNVIFERARFNRRNQQDGESAEQYIMALYNLVENCDYGNLQSEMIRDRLVVGIRDAALSERLQTDAELTLEKAKQTIRQREAVHEQQNLLKGVESQQTVAAVDSHRSYGRQRSNQGGRTNQTKRCTRCGKEAHPRERCPAKDAECYRCKKKGHYGSKCLSRSTADSVAVEDEEDDNTDCAFLDTLTPSKQETTWSTHIQLNNKLTQFKLDTGAEVTAISSATHQQLGKPKLNAPGKLLYGPSRQPLKVLGKFKGTFARNGKQSQQQVYVVTGL